MVWDYKKPNVYCLVYLDFLISVENIHQQVQYLNEILVNAFSNYIPNKWIIIDDNDLSWMNEIKNKINYRNIFYQQLKKYKINLTKLNVVNKLTSELSLIISQRRDEYYSQNCV